MVLFKKIIEELIVPINSSIETKIQVNGRTIIKIYREYNCIAENVVATTEDNIYFLNGNILRQNDGGSWGIVVSSDENELYISKKDRKVRFNIQTLTVYTNNIKLLVEYT